MGTKADFIAALGGSTAVLGGNTFTADATANTLAITGHGRTTGDGPLQVSSTSAAPAGLAANKATGVLTGVSIILNDQTVTIGSRTYTFKTSLTGSADEVLIGADLTASMLNLKKAINGEATAGTNYGTGTVAHADVDCTGSTATTCSLRAKVAGAAGNAIATTETSTVASFGAATLTGGYDNSFYAVVVDDDTLKLATSYANAIAETPVTIDITDTGTGTHTLASTAGGVAEVMEDAVRDMISPGNRCGIPDVLESRFWDRMIAAL